MTATEHLANGGKPADINAYSFIRFSTGEQKLGSSLWRQTEVVRAEILRRHWTFNNNLTISLLGVSAYKGNSFDAKTALGKFLLAAQQNMLLPFAVLVCENPDRFSRAKMDVADATLWGLVKSGVDVLFVNSGLLLTRGDEDDPFKRGMLMMDFKRAFSESERKGKFTSAAICKKLKLAQSGEAVNFGRFRPSWVDFVPPTETDKSRFVLNEKAGLIRRCVDLYLVENKSTTEICRIFNKEGIPSTYGKTWSTSVISQWFHSENLVGSVVVSGARLDRYYPAVVSDSEFEQLQAALFTNGTRRGGQRENTFTTNLFRHHCKCANCGGTVQTMRGHQAKSTGRWQRYFRCSHRSDGICEVHNCASTEALEMDFFGKYLLDFPDQVLLGLDKASQQRLKALRTRLACVDKEAEDAGRLLGIYTTASLETKLKALKTERDELETQIKEQTRDCALSHEAPGAWRQLMDLLKMDPTNTNGSIDKLNVASCALRDQLQDNELRKKLVQYVPQLIKGIKIDLKGKRYAVIDLAGQQGEWRDLAAYMAALDGKRKAMPKKKLVLTPAQKAAQAEAARRYRARNIARGLRGDGQPRRRNPIELRREAIDRVRKSRGKGV